MTYFSIKVGAFAITESGDEYTMFKPYRLVVEEEGLGHYLKGFFITPSGSNVHYRIYDWRNATDEEVALHLAKRMGSEE